MAAPLLGQASKATQVQLAKREMRKALTKVLRAVPDETVKLESDLVTKHILDSSYYQSAKRVSIYLSTPNSEIRTDAIAKDVLRSGKSLFVPFCPPSDPLVMRMLRVQSEEQLAGLPLNKWGIREIPEKEAGRMEDAYPPTSLSQGGLDLILMPGLAFDILANRLGHGRGYYDRYIRDAIAHAKKRNVPPPFTAALALRSQILPPGGAIPTTEWDYKPEVVVHPDGEFEKAGWIGG